MRGYPVHYVNLGAEAVAASTPYVVVDLSDSTNFPHTKTDGVVLLGLILSAEKATDGVFDVWVGAVTENDGTDGSVTWAHVFHLESVHNATDSTDRFAQAVDFTLGGVGPGIDLTVVGGALASFVGNQAQADSANWQNDTNRTSPFDATTLVGVGDLVCLVEEVSDGGTLDFSLTAIYQTV